MYRLNKTDTILIAVSSGSSVTSASWLTTGWRWSRSTMTWRTQKPSLQPGPEMAPMFPIPILWAMVPVLARRPYCYWVKSNLRVTNTSVYYNLEEFVMYFGLIYCNANSKWIKKYLQKIAKKNIFLLPNMLFLSQSQIFSLFQTVNKRRHSKWSFPCLACWLQILTPWVQDLMELTQPCL